MAQDFLGGISGSRKPDPQAVPALSGFDPGRAELLQRARAWARKNWCDDPDAGLNIYHREAMRRINEGCALIEALVATQSTGETA